MNISSKCIYKIRHWVNPKNFDNCWFGILWNANKVKRRYMVNYNCTDCMRFTGTRAYYTVLLPRRNLYFQIIPNNSTWVLYACELSLTKILRIFLKEKQIADIKPNNERTPESTNYNYYTRYWKHANTVSVWNVDAFEFWYWVYNLHVTRETKTI